MENKRLLKSLFIFVGSVALSISGLYAQQGANQYIPVSPRQTVESGIFWPNGQMLPHFATPVFQLDGFDLKKAKLQPEEKTMILSLQGIVNKKLCSIKYLAVRCNTSCLFISFHLIFSS